MFFFQRGHILDLSSECAGTEMISNETNIKQTKSKYYIVHLHEQEENALFSGGNFQFCIFNVIYLL